MYKRKSWHHKQMLNLWDAIVAKKGDPFQGPRVGSCLTLRSELSSETHVPTKQRLYWVGAPRQRAGG